MHNAFLIDSEGRLDHRIVDLDILEDVVEAVVDGLAEWRKESKLDLRSFTVTIRSIPAGLVHATISRFQTRPESLFVVKVDSTISIIDCPTVEVTR